MKKLNEAWGTYLFWIALSEGVGALAGFLTMDSTKIYTLVIVQPPFSPPAWLFPVVWTVLYALMGIGAARISLTASGLERSRGLNLFITQLAVNFFWSLIFFNMQAFGFAFLWLALLWLLVLWMTGTFCEVDRTAALLQIPYVLWVTFAAYLNWGVWRLN